MTQPIEYEVSKLDSINMSWRLSLRTRFMVMNFVWLVLGLYFLFVHNLSLWGTLLLVLPFATIFLGWVFIAIFFSQHPEFNEKQIFTYDDEGMSIENSTTTTKLKWDRLKGLIDTKRFYLFRWDSYGSGAVLPKSMFTEDEEQRFREMLASKGLLKST